MSWAGPLQSHGEMTQGARMRTTLTGGLVATFQREGKLGSKHPQAWGYVSTKASTDKGMKNNGLFTAELATGVRVGKDDC